jgi:hypothetical protein
MFQRWCGCYWLTEKLSLLSERSVLSSYKWLRSLVSAGTKYSQRGKTRNFTDKLLAYVVFFLSGSAAQRGIWPPHLQGFLITHDTPQSVGLLRTSVHPVANTSTWQHQHTQQTNIHAPGGIQTRDRSRRAAVDLRLKPRGHWDRLPMQLRLLYRASGMFLNTPRLIMITQTLYTVSVKSTLTFAVLYLSHSLLYIWFSCGYRTVCYLEEV